MWNIKKLLHTSQKEQSMNVRKWMGYVPITLHIYCMCTSNTSVFPEVATRWAIVFPWESSAASNASGFPSKQLCAWGSHDTTYSRPILIIHILWSCTSLISTLYSVPNRDLMHYNICAICWKLRSSYWWQEIIGTDSLVTASTSKAMDVHSTEQCSQLPST